MTDPVVARPRPRLRIHVRDGLAIFTHVTLDGHDVFATRVSFDTGDVRDRRDGTVTCKLEFQADVDVEMDGGLVELSRVPTRLDLHPNGDADEAYR
jgi:hypothetical protein